MQKLNRLDRGARFKSIAGKDRQLSGAKGNFAEALRAAWPGVSWAGGKYPTDCHMIFL
jgi:hypothetical protein